MYILKNAWISIKRNKGRNILIGIIIFIIAMASTITLAIKNTASDLIDSYMNAYNKEVTIGFNREDMMKDFNMGDVGGRDEIKEKFNNIATYSISDIESFADSKYVSSYYYTYSVGMNGSNIEKAEIEDDRGFGGRGEKFNNMENQSDFTLMGYSSLDAMSEFINGTYTMEDISDNAWNIAFDGNYVFINSELASYNNLKLNDKITLTSTDSKTFEYQIIGIFKQNEDDSQGMSMFSGSANTIITNSDNISKIVNDNVKGNLSPTFIINSYSDVSRLQDEFYEKGLDKNYILETNEEMATAAVSSVKNVNSFSTTFLVLTLIIGGVVLFVINMINIRERKYEIGVLRTIGVSKFKLTMQFVFELIIVALVALLIGAGIGGVTSKSISNSLLASEIENSNNQNEEINKNFGGHGPGENKLTMKGRGVPTVQAYSKINAVVDIVVIVELLGIGLLLVIVSSIASLISIQRFSPLTILKERS